MDAAGNLYIADHSADCVHKLDTSGIVTSAARRRSRYSRRLGARLTAPDSVTWATVDVDSAGNLYIAEVAIQVPATLADGDWPIVATIAGVDSPAGVVLSLKK